MLETANLERSASSWHVRSDLSARSRLCRSGTPFVDADGLMPYDADVVDIFPDQQSALTLA